MMKSKPGRGDDKRHVETEENWIAGSLNFVVFLATAAVAYTDWIVVPNVVPRLSLCAAHCAKRAGQSPAAHRWLGGGVYGSAGPLRWAPDDLQVRIVRDVIALAGFLVVAFLVTPDRQATRPPGGRGTAAAGRVRARSDPGLPGTAAGIAETSHPSCP